MDANKDQEKKEGKLRLLFQNIFHELSEIIEADGATLFLCDEEKEELYSFAFLNDKNGMKVDEIRVPYYKGIVGACMKKAKSLT